MYRREVVTTKCCKLLGTCRDGRLRPSGEQSERARGCEGEDKQIPRLRLRNDNFFNTGITLNAGDIKKIPNLTLDIGQAQETVTVSENSQIIPVENGQRAAVLDSKDIQQLALESRNLTELLKVLPGVTSVANGISTEIADHYLEALDMELLGIAG